jgi:curved DNA-binding protein CbpA
MSAEPIIDLTAEQQQRIDELFAQLKSLTLYEVLGVPPTSDKKAIKGAYFARANEFHPDRFFRKSLGPYKSKMEIIFARVSEAHDILCSPTKRAEYDAAFRARRFSLIDEMLAEAASEMAGAEDRALHEDAAVDESIRIEDSEPPPQRVSHTTLRAPALPADAQARREALAKRLLGPGGRRASKPPPKK